MLRPWVAGQWLVAFVVGTGVAAAQTEYVGTLRPSLQPSGGPPSATLLPAKRGDLERLPRMVGPALIMRGVLPVPWHSSGIAVALVEPESGAPAVYADLDADGRWGSGEALRTSVRSRAATGAAVTRSEGLVFHLPLPRTSPWPDLPLIVWPVRSDASGTVSPSAMRMAAGACVAGDVPVDGRTVLVRLCDNISPGTGDVDPMHGVVEVDTDRDGTIVQSAYSAEVADPDGEAAVFAVGSRYLSVGKVDARKGTLVLHEHTTQDYTRIRFELGLAVPDFAFVDFEGASRRLSEFRGKHLLLQVWGTWCPPCVSDMPGLARVYADYRDRGFEILGLNDERTSKGPKNPDEVTARARALAARQGAGWPQARTEVAEAIVRRFRIGIHPTYILLDPAGRIVSWAARGQLPLRGEKLRDTLDRLLPESPSVTPVGSLRVGDLAYVGRLSGVLAPDASFGFTPLPCRRLDHAERGRLGIPVSPRDGICAGELLLGTFDDRVPFYVLEPPDGPAALFVRQDGIHLQRWAFEPLRDGSIRIGQRTLAFPVSGAPFPEYPVTVYETTRTEVDGNGDRVLQQSFDVVVDGSVDIDGRPTRVRYWWKRLADPPVTPSSTQGVDSNGDGEIASLWPSVEVATGSTVPPVFRVGLRFLSTRVIDVATW